MVEIKNLYTSELNLKAIKKVYTGSNWDWLSSDAEMLESFKNSYSLYGGYIEDELVCFARTISDGKIYGLVVDVLVLPDHRNQGYAKKLIDHLTKDMKSQGVKVLQLLASKEGKQLYSKVGFSICPEQSPGMIKFL
ncbi:GNAT family N-acetyltransferase [bacterium]|nr:GNAT family N-acetyltransferase [bacterium]